MSQWNKTPTTTVPRTPAYGQAHPEAQTGSTAFIHEGGAETMRLR